MRQGGRGVVRGMEASCGRYGPALWLFDRRFGRGFERGLDLGGRHWLVRRLFGIFVGAEGSIAHRAGSRSIL